MNSSTWGRGSATSSPGRADREAVRSIALAEMAEIAARGVPARWRSLAERAARVGLSPAASSLARALASLDRELAHGSLRRAALATLHRYGVGARVQGPGLRLSALEWATAPVPAKGPLLVVANHPGLFDALALFAAVAREDLLVLVARRPLLDALPNLSRRMLAIEPQAGTGAVRMAVRHLASGGALLHFPAGRIEPDPRLAPPARPVLHDWKPGLDTIVRASVRAGADLRAVPMLVSGVVSRRASTFARTLTRSDVATDAIVPLVQLTLPGFGDVDVRVSVGDVVRAAGLETAAHLRSALEALTRNGCA